MSKPPRACIRVTALKIGLIRFESRKNFPKIIGLSCFLSHHCSFNLFREGRYDWFLLTLGSRGNLPTCNTKIDFLLACCTSQSQLESSFDSCRFTFSFPYQTSGKGKGSVLYFSRIQKSKSLRSHGGRLTNFTGSIRARLIERFKERIT